MLKKQLRGNIVARAVDTALVTVRLVSSNHFVVVGGCVKIGCVKIFGFSEPNDGIGHRRLNDET